MGWFDLWSAVGTPFDGTTPPTSGTRFYVAGTFVDSTTADSSLFMWNEATQSIVTIPYQDYVGAIGIDTILSGTATLNVGADSVIVTHGIGTAPSINNINVIPQGDIQGLDYWVENITTTTFKIKVSDRGYLPLSSSVNFSWQIFNVNMASITLGVEKDTVANMIGDSLASYSFNSASFKRAVDKEVNEIIGFDATMDSQADSVVGHWVFDSEFASFYNIDSIEYDLSGNGNNLNAMFDVTPRMIGESPVFTNGRSILFDGSTMFFEIDTLHDSKLEMYHSNFTIEAWVKSNSKARQYIVSKHNATSNYLFLIQEDDGDPVTSGRLSCKITCPTASEQIRSDEPINDGQWHYVAVTVDYANNKFKLYDNGLWCNSTATNISDLDTIYLPSDPFLVGAIEENPTNVFDGYIAEVRISKRALSETEIFNHYKKSLRLFESRYSAKTVAYKTRVEADGGTVISMNVVEDMYTSQFNWANITSWVGVQFGVKYDANGKVTKLYDLSDNENDFIQADTSKSFTFNYNGMTLDGNRIMQSTFASEISQPNIFSIVTDKSNVLNTYLCDGISSTKRHAIFGSTAISLYAGTLYNSAVVSYNPMLLTVRWDTTDSIFVNNSYQASHDAGSQSLTGMMLGGFYDGTPGYSGLIKEMVISDDATIRQKIEANINKRWSIY